MQNGDYLGEKPAGRRKTKRAGNGKGILSKRGD
jgi:hypothetical protein